MKSYELDALLCLWSLSFRLDSPLVFHRLVSVYHLRTSPQLCIRLHSTARPPSPSKSTTLHTLVKTRKRHLFVFAHLTVSSAAPAGAAAACPPPLLPATAPRRTGSPAAHPARPATDPATPLILPLTACQHGTADLRHVSVAGCGQSQDSQKWQRMGRRSDGGSTVLRHGAALDRLASQVV